MEVCALSRRWCSGICRRNLFLFKDLSIVRYRCWWNFVLFEFARFIVHFKPHVKLSLKRSRCTQSEAAWKVIAYLACKISVVSIVITFHSPISGLLFLFLYRLRPWGTKFVPHCFISLVKHLSLLPVIHSDIDVLETSALASITMSLLYRGTFLDLWTLPYSRFILRWNDKTTSCSMHKESSGAHSSMALLASFNQSSGSFKPLNPYSPVDIEPVDFEPPDALDNRRQTWPSIPSMQSQIHCSNNYS